ncbi:MAG: A/G-specific adenine glycosylase [Capsulimonadaceae bacterium]
MADRLLDWFDANKRDLPWRRYASNPYAVWVSEIMLQQTTVAAVVSYFERWMEHFPTIADLADAPIDDVLRLWAGLGYYARARNLHRAAQLVMRRHAGVVPRDPDALRSLPGIGPYTAGAILSIAYNLDEPVVDTNVTRVLTRHYALDGDPKADSAIQAALWDRAASLIPAGHASEFNQALMDLGATVCDSSTPRCLSCPLQWTCAALKFGDPTAFPRFARAGRWESQEHVSVAADNGAGQIMLARRAVSESLWGGLWELPRAVRVSGETLEECAARALHEGLGWGETVAVRAFGTLNHVVARRKIALHGMITRVPTDCPVNAPRSAAYDSVAWTAPDDLNDYAMATPQVRLLGLLTRYRSQGSLDLF